MTQEASDPEVHVIQIIVISESLFKFKISKD
jgi:hypothetical protein